ncbi:MAG: DUF1203 domain-containing protein, partial [Alteraurantiacibacter sp.]
IQGLDPKPFSHFFAMSEGDMAEHRATLKIANASRGFPCRVSLQDAAKGEELLLVHHVNHAVETPYRNAFAIFVRRDAKEAARFVDECPPVLADRPISFRAYDAAGNLSTARLAMAGASDETIREMLTDPAIAYIDAHNAAHGCFVARVHHHD